MASLQQQHPPPWTYLCRSERLIVPVTELWLLQFSTVCMLPIKSLASVLFDKYYNNFLAWLIQMTHAEKVSGSLACRFRGFLCSHESLMQNVIKSDIYQVGFGQLGSDSLWVKNRPSQWWQIIQRFTIGHDYNLVLPLKDIKSEMQNVAHKNYRIMTHNNNKKWNKETNQMLSLRKSNPVAKSLRFDFKSRAAELSELIPDLCA